VHCENEQQPNGGIHGPDLSRADRRIFLHEHSARARLRTTKETIVSLFYVLGGIVSIGLLLYLIIALLKPELF
jgi:K+-transporting ATPase KdpF subunit